MTFRNGLFLGFCWVHCNGEYSHSSAVLASYHHPRSITWRWALYWHKAGKPILKIITWNRLPSYGSYTVTLPFVGSLRLVTQEHMFRHT